MILQREKFSPKYFWLDYLLEDCYLGIQIFYLEFLLLNNKINPHLLHRFYLQGFFWGLLVQNNGVFFIVCVCIYFLSSNLFFRNIILL